MFEDALKAIRELTSKEVVETIRFNKKTVTLKLKGEKAQSYNYRSAFDILEAIEFSERQLKK